MLRRADWFQPKVIGWGIAPVTWQGWIWTMTWAAALTILRLGSVNGPSDNRYFVFFCADCLPGI